MIQTGVREETVPFLIDPSLLLHRGSIAPLEDLIANLDGRYRPYIPQPFELLLRDGLERHYDALVHDQQGEESNLKGQNLYRFYSIYKADRAVSPGRVREMLDTINASSVGREDFSYQSDGYRSLYSKLPYQEGDTRREILFVEAVFMFEASPVLSRIRKPFRKLIDSGLSALEFGQDTVDDVVEIVETRQATLDEFGVEPPSHQDTSSDQSDDDLTLFGQIYELLEKAKSVYQKTRHHVYLAFGDLVEVFNEYFGEEPLASKITATKDRIESLITELKEKHPDMNEEIDELIDELERPLTDLAIPPGVRQVTAVLRILFSVSKFTFALVDP